MPKKYVRIVIAVSLQARLYKGATAQHFRGFLTQLRSYLDTKGFDATTEYATFTEDSMGNDIVVTATYTNDKRSKEIEYRLDQALSDMLSKVTNSYKLSIVLHICFAESVRQM